MKIALSLFSPLAILSLLAAPPVAGQEPGQAVRRIAAAAALAAQEYRLGVREGRVVSTAEVEEARLFLAEALRSADALPADAAIQARTELAGIAAMVEQTAAPESVSTRVRALASGLAARLTVSLDETPILPPSLALGSSVFRARCAKCHGELGRGDGAAAGGLDPPPANLADSTVMGGRTPLDFYRRITIGAAGTAMPAFEGTLSAEERWAVAFYAISLHQPPGGVAQVFAAVRRQVDSAHALVLAGRAPEARQAAFDAYLIFEGVERQVSARSPGLVARAEASFAELRDRAGAGDARDVTRVRHDLEVVLEQSERLVEGRPSPLNLFVQSLVILLREGLEAILVVGALMAFVLRTGAASRRRDIHLGVGAAVVASLLTALVIETVFHLTPSRQELLEGLTLAAAAGTLFYVSYWLLTKIETRRWNEFVKAKVEDALGSGSALALGSVAFLAVYREGFETVLFYKALVVAGGPDGLLPVVGGITAGSAALAVVYLAINRWGLRLPLKPFFGVTSAFLYYMAFVFAGKAVAELQESGVVTTTLVEWAPRVPVLGIYPTVESLGAQLLLVVLALAALVRVFSSASGRASGTGTGPGRPGPSRRPARSASAR